MAQLKSFVKKIVLMVIMITIIISSCAVPNSYAKLTIKEGEFYYAGTTKGSYVPSENIFSWLFNILAEIASFLLTLIPNGIRMAFVGWTALAEKLLTWALETTSGVNLAGEDVSATDLSKLSDSTNNVTIQAIVYNMVPALNVNFFDLEFKDMYIKEIKEKDADGNITTKKVMISPTGQQLICKKCKKSVLECCGEWDKESNKEVKCYGTPQTGSSATGDCGCKGCAACSKYAEVMLAKDPIIIQLKKLVAVWYYIIRLLAIAAMCVVLIGIGIKMAISTIASDKAVFKRMLVDWVAGMILIFTMHYIMYFSIVITETLVNMVRESANSINKVQLMQLAETTSSEKETEKSNQDIEIDVYEEIRTRAYDFNFMVGLVGMIMYITLVFMAFKYTLIYLKRFLTLAVLTLMAPALGVAYALQKALSGKSSSLKTWLTEYLINLLIQVVHALIYAVFISAALVFSLENVSGVIVALILMNFSLKAEGLFRRIFNLDPGNKGLLGGAMSAPDQAQKSIKAAKAMYLGAKPLAKAFTAPGRAAARGAGKMIAYGALKGISTLRESSRNENSSEESVSNTGGGASSASSGDSSRGTSAEGTSTGTQNVAGDVGVLEEKLRVSNVEAPKIGQHEEDKMLLAQGEDALQEEFAKAKDEFKKDPKDEDKATNLLEANRKLERYREISAREANDISVGDVILGHIDGLFNLNNYIDITVGADGKIQKVPKPGAIFGTYKYDQKTGNFKKDTSGAAFSQLSAANLLGFTDEDKKIFKDQVWMPAVKGIGGMASMFLGMGNLVAHPVIGMGMLSGGAGMTGSMLNKFRRPDKDAPGRLKCLKLAKSQGQWLPGRRLKFGSFTTPTMMHIRDEAVKDANKVLAMHLNAKMKQNHPKLLEKLKADLVRPKTLFMVAGLGIVPVAAMEARALKKGEPLYKDEQDPRNGSYRDINNPYQLDASEESKAERIRLRSMGNSSWNIVDKHHFKQFEEQKTTFLDEANTLINQTVIDDTEDKVTIINQRTDKKVDEMDIREYDEELVKVHAAMGYKYDPVTQERTPIIDVEKSDVKTKIDITDESGNVIEKDREITQADIDTVNRKMEAIIASKLDGMQVNINDEKVMDEIIADLSSELAKANIIGAKQDVSILFEGGDKKLKSAIKEKAAFVNKVVSESKEYKLNTDEFEIVQQAIQEVASEAATKGESTDLSKLDQSKIFAKVQEKMKQPVEQPNSKPDKSKHKPKTVTDTVDTMTEQVAVDEKYKTAISAMLANKQGLPTQNELNTELIRSRVMTATDPSTRKAEKVSDKENRDIIRKSVKKKIAEFVETYSQENVTVEDKTTKTKKKIVSREEKLQQAQLATEGLDSISREAILDSLFVITGMQESIKAINVQADGTLGKTSKFMKSTHKNRKKHLEAEMELSTAKIEKANVEKELIEKGDKKEKASEIIGRLSEATEKVKVAEEKFARTGPVQNVNTATQDVLKLLGQRKN